MSIVGEPGCAWTALWSGRLEVWGVSAAVWSYKKGGGAGWRLRLCGRGRVSMSGALKKWSGKVAVAERWLGRVMASELRLED